MIRWRTARLAVTLVAALVAAAPTARAQASLYVPLDDIAYRYADALIARGELRGLSLLERPYTAHALAAAADSTLAGTHSAVIRSYAVALRRALVRYATGPADSTTSANRATVLINGDLFGTAETSGEPELMQASGDGDATGGAGIRLAMVAGPVAVMMHPIADNRMNYDPTFTGRTDRAITGRMQDAYVSGQWRYAQVFLGRIARNWGPYALQGLQLGNAPYTYDQAYLHVGTDHIHLSAIAAKLDDSFQPEGVYERYFYSHRVGVAWRGFEASVSEGYLAAGIGRSYDLSLLNPLNIYSLSWRNEGTSGNLNIGTNLAYRTRHSGNYMAELFIDDMQIDRCNPLCKEPSSYGFTLSAEGVPLWRDQRVFASYTRLTGLAYRTPLYAEQYSSAGTGLGREFSDYDEGRIGVDLAVVPYTTLRLYGAYRRQGEGDYHVAFPLPSEYPTIRGFLEGTIERVTRLGITGGVMILPGVEITGDVGYNRTTNAQHVPGVTTTGIEGRGRLQWTPRGLTF